MIQITLKNLGEFPDASTGNFKLVPKEAGIYEVERRATQGEDWYFFSGSNVGVRVEYFKKFVRKGGCVIEGDPLFKLNSEEVKK